MAAAISSAAGSYVLSTFISGTSNTSFVFCPLPPPALPTSLSFPWLPDIPDIVLSFTSDFPAPAAGLFVVLGFVFSRFNTTSLVVVVVVVVAAALTVTVVLLVVDVPPSPSVRVKPTVRELVVGSSVFVFS